jgi:nitroimidazol reductase NimA-like FMN-containing flavoprotein (pyridoxamine 5'-phosphate oxidase superfamily)
MDFFDRGNRAMETSSTSDLARTTRTTLRRLPQRGVYDRDVIHAILDEALVCHVAFVDEGQPYVIPTVHVRIGSRLYVHGSQGSRMLRCLREGAPACVTVTLLDGLVLARSAFHHSMNYRSVVILGVGDAVDDRARKLEVFEALVEHVMAGRWNDVRRPTPSEVDATAVVSFPISEASAKIRIGPPKDDDEDYSLPIWAGIIPLALQAGTPIADPLLAQGIEPPAYVTAYGLGPADDDPY